jgi:two-component system CheB/CheR fusion protein
MLDYLVDWARIKYAAEAFSPENIDLAKYVDKVFDTLNEIAIGNKIYLYNETEHNTMVYADKKMLLSIIQNIVSNGIKNTNPEGKITVSANRKVDKVVVEIKDTGVGMSRSVREKLFAPQLKALSRERKENKGAGIGLLLTKGFVDKNGGEIWVESSEGKGTSFFFTLPAERQTDFNLDT